MDPSETLEPFDSIGRGALKNRHGLPYKEFKLTLTPKYAVVWTHLLAGYAALALIAVAIAAVTVRFPALWVATSLPGGLLLGYAIAYIQLFLHEAAHYNLVKDRKTNDFLANLVIGSMVGQDIKTYRRIHFDHHRHLGTPEDTEHSYFDSLNLRFLARSLSGSAALRVLTERGKMAGSAGYGVWVLIGVALNAAVVAGSSWLGLPGLAVAWLLGVVVFCPFFLAVRQLLEHRGDDADKAVNYHEVPHGPVNRLFGDGILASTLGGAGFNRHLLHHWEPQISYARLKELERYLSDTDLAPALDLLRTTYVKTSIRLFNS